MKIFLLPISLLFLFGIVPNRAINFVRHRYLGSEDPDTLTSCKPEASQYAKCEGTLRPFCTPYRSPDYCPLDESFPYLIQTRTARAQEDSAAVLADGHFFHLLEDKIKGYLFSTQIAKVKAPRLLYCGDNASDALLGEYYKFNPADSVSKGGFVIRATNLHSGHGVYVFPDGFDAVELLSGIVMSVTDVITQLTAAQANKIIIEEYIAGLDGVGSLPTEYKAHVINGKVESINVVYNRGNGGSCACWAEVDTEWNRLDTYGCFIPGGFQKNEPDVNGQCNDIDFNMGARKAHPIKGMDICKDVDSDICLADIIETAERVGNLIGAYVRVDMFLSNTGEVVVQEYTSNHMGGTRHCSAKKESGNGGGEVACVNSCFLGEAWKKASAMYGGPQPAESTMNAFLDELNETEEELCQAAISKRPQLNTYELQCDHNPKGNINGSVMEDVDNDGYGNVPIEGVVITLSISVTDQIVATTITDSDGNYVFVNLPDGTYFVTNNNLNNNYIDVSDSDGGPDLNNITVVFSASIGSNGNDFVDLRPGSITGTVTDSQGDPILNVVLTLTTGTDDLAVATTLSDSSGIYVFTSIPPSQYTVIGPLLPSYPARTRDEDEIADMTPDDFDSNTTVDGRIGVTLLPGETDTGNNFGYTDRGRITGSVTDEATNPIQDVTIMLTDAVQNVVATTLTNAAGAYSFDDLAPGNYTLTQANLPGYPGSKSDSDESPDGDEGELDGPLGADNIIQVTLQPSEMDSDNNFVDILKSEVPSHTPSSVPSLEPSLSPSDFPSATPSGLPSVGIPLTPPTVVATSTPSLSPSITLSSRPSALPSSVPSSSPSALPSSNPSQAPSSDPSSTPSMLKSLNPSEDPSAAPSNIPSMSPSLKPSGGPSLGPSSEPSTNPSATPSENPSLKPSSQPSASPSRAPSLSPSETPSNPPTVERSAVPSPSPSDRPSVAKSNSPSLTPSSSPSDVPSSAPSMAPSKTPSSDPSSKPSLSPSNIPSSQPSEKPSILKSSIPSLDPSFSPSSMPSVSPSMIPSQQPSQKPSGDPSSKPSSAPSSAPSANPSASPSENPSTKPSSNPSAIPSRRPSLSPSETPSNPPTVERSAVPSPSPSDRPSVAKSNSPSLTPSSSPSDVPSSAPSMAPSKTPSSDPSSKPSLSPSNIPSSQPSEKPSILKSSIPSLDPSFSPSSMPSVSPSMIPSQQPSQKPSGDPSSKPSSAPSSAPSANPSASPSENPSTKPSSNPSAIPSRRPSLSPSETPSNPPTVERSAVPSPSPSDRPSVTKSNSPSLSPSLSPSHTPSLSPSVVPSLAPSRMPSSDPSSKPSLSLSSMPSTSPSTKPSLSPSRMPSHVPSTRPSSKPSSGPSISPSLNPSVTPSWMPSSKPSWMPSVSPSEGPSESPTETICVNEAISVCFALDQSLSICGGSRKCSNYLAEETFASNVASAISNASPDTRYALVTFSSQANKRLSLSTFNTFDTTLRTTPLNGGYTNTQQGIIACNEILATSTRSIKVTFLITDGNPTAAYLNGDGTFGNGSYSQSTNINGPNTVYVDAAKTARNAAISAGIDIISVGVGTGISQTNLVDFSTAGRTFRAASFDTLDSAFVKSVLGGLCE